MQPAHLLALSSLSSSALETYMTLIEKTKTHTKQGGQFRIKPTTVVNLFFEASTRTRLSFELAEKKLGLSIVSLQLQNSSLSKGETLNDTIDNLHAMGITLVVVRHASSGAAHTIAQHTKINVINAGDGQHEHPTQGLLDAFTLWENWQGQLRDKKVTILGDIRHSRVARSNLQALPKLGVRVSLYGPQTLVPQELAQIPNVEIAQSQKEAFSDTDAVIVLRLQKERMQQGFLPDLSDYIRAYALSQNIVTRYFKPSTLILHPGPINREIEIASQVADSLHNRILSQVENGVYTRMAVLLHLLEGTLI